MPTPLDALVAWYAPPALTGSAAIAVRGLGIRERMPPIIVDRPGGTDDVLLMHFHDRVQVFVDGEMRQQPANAWIAWRPGMRHRFGDLARAWTHSWIHCRGDAIDAALAAGRFTPGEPVALPDAALVDRYLPTIHDEVERGRRTDAGLVAGLIELWLRAVARDARAGDAAVPGPLRAAKAFIHGNLAKPLRLPRLAARAGLSVSQFSARFQRHFGHPPMRYLARSRMLQAAHLLRDRNRPIAAVATAVGFADPFHFSRAFRAFHGASPRTWREKRS